MQAPRQPVLFPFKHPLKHPPVHTFLLALLLGALGACSTPPQPPSVDESTRRPANSALAVELQVCQSELHNTRIDAQEAARNSARAADAARVAAVTQATQQAWMAQASHPPAANNSSESSTTSAADRSRGDMHPSATSSNAIYPVLFAYGSTRVNLPDADATRLLAEARDAPLIVLRGRTDGSTESVTESRIARERSAAVQAYLVRAGIDPNRIRATWQPVGDHAADNRTDDGRTLNRRVEIEIYRAAPHWITRMERMALGPADTSPTTP